MGKTVVAIVKGDEPSEITKKALKLIGAKNLIKQESKVLIKPNYVVAKHPSTGITTDSRIVESLIEFVKDCGVKDITVGEGGVGDTGKAFNVVGIKEVAARHGVKLIDLNQDLRVKMKIPHALALHEVDIAETGFKSTCIINVPKLKVHHMALVTLCMKNLMGLILPKSIMHDQINEKIVDLASLFKEKVKINVVDGVIGAEVDETHGEPVEMNIVIAGQDMVAVDSVAAAAMGIDYRNVKYLQLAEERGLGISNIDEIKIIGESIEKVKKKFRIR
jgi:uncharacterized protein (DUF362 family)